MGNVRYDPVSGRAVVMASPQPGGGPPQPLPVNSTTPLRQAGIRTPPPPAPRDYSYNGALKDPGAYEDWWKKYGADLNGPSKGDTAYNSTQDAWGNLGYQPTGTNFAYNQAQNDLGHGPLYGSTNAQNIAKYFGAGPGYGETTGRDVTQQLTAPGSGEMYYGATNGVYRTPGGGENWVRQNQSQFNAPGAAEANLGIADRDLSAINYAKDTFGTTGNVLSRDAQNTLGYDRAHGADVSNVSRYFVPGLAEKSYSERMLDSGTGGLIDPYQRTFQKQLRNLQNAAAAEGRLDAGSSKRLEEELAADTAASEANARIGLANQADQSKVARSLAGTNIANTGFTAGLAGAQAADQSTRGNLGTLETAAQGASTEGLQKVQARTTAANDAEQNMIQRLFQGGQLGLAADKQQIDRTTAGQGAADSAQTMGLQRLMDELGAGKTVQDLETNRLKTSADTGISADDANLRRISGLLSAGVAKDSSTRDAETFARDTLEKGVGMANAVDTGDLNRYVTTGNAAKTAQDEYQGRQGDIYGQEQGLANAESGAVSGATQLSASEQANLGTESIRALTTKLGMNYQQAQALVQQLMSTGQTALLYHLIGKSPPGGSGTAGVGDYNTPPGVSQTA